MNEVEKRVADLEDRLAKLVAKNTDNVNRLDALQSQRLKRDRELNLQEGWLGAFVLAIFVGLVAFLTR